MMKPRKLEALLRRAKKAGISREEAGKIILSNLLPASKQWRPSERAMALADWTRAVEKVYGPGN